MWTLISNLFSAIGSIFGHQSKRSDLKNAADVRASKVAQAESDRVSKVESAVERRDEKTIRKELAE